MGGHQLAHQHSYNEHPLTLSGDQHSQSPPSEQSWSG